MIPIDVSLHNARAHYCAAHGATALNDDFADIITGEKIHITQPLKEEVDDEDMLVLPRIAFGFDRRHYGRLRQLIDVLNSF